MRLAELTGVKKYHDLTADEVLDALAKQHKLKVIRTGLYGKVIVVPNKDIVYKIFDNDEPYMSFVKYAMENPDPHYPKFVRAPKLMHSFYRRTKEDPNKFTVVGVEKLNRLDRADELILRYMRTIFKLIERKQFDFHDVPLFTPGVVANTDNKTYAQIFDMYPQMRSLTNAVYRMFRSGQVFGKEDLHLGNIMKRTDGTYVIIDPVSGTYETGMKQDQRNATQQHEKTVSGPVYTKLTELTGVKKYHDYTADELMDELSSYYGLKVIGDGIYGKVLEVPGKPYIYKVFDNDEPYLSFVRYAIANPDEHLPKFIRPPKTIHSFHRRAPTEPNKFTVIGIERLIKLTGQDVVVVRFLSRIFRDMSLGQWDAEVVPEFLPGIIHNDDNKTYREILDAIPQANSLLYTFQKMVDSKQVIGQDDLSPQNLMRRDDGTYVIIDPVISDDGSIDVQLSRRLIPLEKKTVLGPVYDKKDHNIKETRFDKRAGIGAIPKGADIDYFGIEVQMKPSQFLRMVPNDSYNKEYQEKMNNFVRNGGTVSPPFLEIKIPREWENGDFSGMAEIHGHEGRHRCRAILNVDGDMPITVFLFFTYYRRHSIKSEFIEKINKKIKTEMNTIVRGPWFELRN